MKIGKHDPPPGPLRLSHSVRWTFAAVVSVAIMVPATVPAQFLTNQAEKLPDVAARDERLKDGNERIRRLGEELNASIRDYNELGERHAKLVQEWNDQQARLTAMHTNGASSRAR